jgi:hypothetical protein
LNFGHAASSAPRGLREQAVWKRWIVATHSSFQWMGHTK